MKIKNLKINGFGKLKDKEINLKQGINIIYGENEAGKSTLLKFISSMFYGLSKNKNGGTLPEIEKYEPWKAQEFSGKITYELDNGRTYEVYRDFKKKNPKIFNENLEDISKEFNIDKTKGNQFFYDQLGIEEEVFVSSIITKQAEVKLDEKTQNSLMQKISNILGTGEDTTSYTSIVNKLKKKLNDEVGTSNTKERPINIVENGIKELKNLKRELEQYCTTQFEIEEQINTITTETEKNQKELERLKSANRRIEELKEQNNRIKVNQEMVQNIDGQLENLKDERKKYAKKDSDKSTKINIAILIILAIITITVELFTSNSLVHILVRTIPVIFLIYAAIKYRKVKKVQKQKREQLKNIDGKMKILEENKEGQEKELDRLKTDYEKELLKIKQESAITNLENIGYLVEEKQNVINGETLKLHTLEIDKNTILPKLEQLVKLEEELEDLEENKVELEEKRENIKRAIQYLEIAYSKMKEQITPKFTEELSKVMKNISNGKYDNVRMNTKGEMIVETNGGEYIYAEQLSIGTIDQLYLSLRLATMKEITKENMPIILDESFAYYDNERLTNILEYLAKGYPDKQVLIFTCTKREIELLEELTIEYNKIEL